MSIFAIRLSLTTGRFCMLNTSGTCCILGIFVALFLEMNRPFNMVLFVSHA